MLENRGTRQDFYWIFPWKVMESPDPWQVDLSRQIVTREEDTLSVCSRQIGKTTAVSASAYIVGALGGFVLVIAPSDPQSMEFVARVVEHHKRVGLDHLVEETKHELRFASGGRILALPNNAKTVRIYSAVDLLVIEEAAQVPDVLYGSVSPMLAVSGGRTALLSTPFGKRGFFYQEATGQGDEKWRVHRYTWRSCPRLDPAFILREKRKHGDLWVMQEYECEFLDLESGYFDAEAFDQLTADYTVEW